MLNPPGLSGEPDIELKEDVYREGDINGKTKEILYL